jgi:O-antigen chain-terminating methyltransferase
VLSTVFLRPQQAFNSAVVQYLNSLERLHMAAQETARYRESLAARELRIEAALARFEEIRVSIGLLQQSTHQLKHEVARLAEGGTAGATAPSPARSVAETLDSYKYVGFEDQFRGSPADIRDRLATYVPIFSGANDVLDLGCGRGEFLALLREAGVRARGIDLNASMVQVCRERNLDATEADALGYLLAQRPESLGGLFAAQVIEHLEPAYLTRVLDAAFGALRPGSPIVLETINPACWYAFFSSYIRDITHVRPLHPDTLQYLLVAAGFQRVEIRYRSPYPDADKLQPVSDRSGMGDWAPTLNANVQKLNSLLFTWLDYAAVGYRP